MLSDYPKSLAQWLERIEACHPEEIELGLDRVKAVYDRLGIELANSRRVVVAGTNGKGSTLTMMESIARCAGVTTGVYTSPHFLRYNERVRINGEEVDDALLCRQFEKIEQARGDIELTYFEYGTLAALLCFEEAQPELLLLEVGLGGRLDAVNIVDGDLAIITTIALDHTDWLGPDRDSIAREKAGIMRAGKPALIGDSDPPQALFDIADKTGAKVLCRGRDYLGKSLPDSWDWEGVDQLGERFAIRGLPKPSLPLVNAVTALQALQLLGFTIGSQAIHSGLRRAQMTGRMQRIMLPEGAAILDVAHNPEAAAYLAGYLEANPAEGQTHMVLGMLKDKDMASVIAALSAQISSWYFASLPGARGTEGAALAEIARREASVIGEAHDSVAQALAHARASMQKGDRVVVAGSFFTVSEALDALELRG